MTDVRLPASGNIQVRWHAVNAFADPSKPTPTEVNAGLILTDSISWQDYSFALKASNTNKDPSLAAKSNTADRGALQYGGAISLYLPEVLTDASNEYKLAHDALRIPRTAGWLTIQLDGELSETSTPTYSGGLTQTATSGDFIDVFKVQTAGYANAITGEEAFRETVTFLPQGEAYIDAVVATTLTVVLTPATSSKVHGTRQIVALAATVNGRKMTNALKYTSSDVTKATVSGNGVVTIPASATAGTVTITGTYDGASATTVITLT